MYFNQTYLKQFLSNIALPHEAAASCMPLFQKIIEPSPFSRSVEEIGTQLFQGGDSRTQLQTLAQAYQLSVNLLFLACAIAFSAEAKERYQQQGIPEAVFWDTMGDISIWANVCYRETGQWGLKEYHWIVLQLKGEVIRLGRLQFQLVFYAGSDCNVGEHRLTAGDQVINIHIPEGPGLTTESRLDAYRRAWYFYGPHPFICHSWLLYPFHREFLPTTSHILDFMNDFVLVDPSETDNFGMNMWRIFGRRERYLPAELPRDTGLQRAYADWIEKHGKVGDATGVFFFDGERIIR